MMSSIKHSQIHPMGCKKCNGITHTIAEEIDTGDIILLCTGCNNAVKISYYKIQLVEIMIEGS